MPERFGIAGAGNWIVDLVKVIEKWPDEEHLVDIISETRGTGGAPYNVLVGLRALDPAIPLQAIGVVGHDEFGHGIRSHLARLDIDSALIRESSEKPTSYTDVMTSAATGKRTFFHNRGANSLLSGEDFEWDRITARILHLGYLMLLDELDAPDPASPERPCAARVLEEAGDAGIATSLDMVSDLSDRMHRIVEPALPQVDYFVANELEAGTLTGCPIRGENGEFRKENLLPAAKTLFERGVRRLVVIHMPEGGFWLDRDTGFSLFQPSINIPRELIRGTAGAGDAFCGGILYGIHEGWTAGKCLELAVSHAARCLLHYNTTDGLVSLGETLAFGKKFGFRTGTPQP